MPIIFPQIRSIEAADVAAILDLGKTRAKITLLSSTGAVLASRDAASEQFARKSAEAIAIEAIGAWCENTLVELYRAQPFAHLIAVTHGATAVALFDKSKSAIARDYEIDIDAEISAQYETQRPNFSSTGSPSLPLGLNLGRQLFSQHLTGDISGAEILLTYPQYWTWRWCGARGTDASSLGCHSDLWEPHTATWSSLAKNNGWDQLFPPLIEAGAVAGELNGALAERIKPAQPIRVYWGLHDSNAALAAFLGERKSFTVLSTGTWLVAFAVGANRLSLDAARDTLWNVDVYGRPVASARFMAGREREAIAGQLPSADISALKSLLQTDALVLPSFAPGGCFPNRRGEIISSVPITDSLRAALASLYLALMIDAALDLIGSVGDIIVEGPIANDTAALCALAALRPQQNVMTTAINCVAQGAAKLIFGDTLPLPSTQAIALDTELIPVLNLRREQWRQFISENSLQENPLQENNK